MYKPTCTQLKPIFIQEFNCISVIFLTFKKCILWQRLGIRGVYKRQVKTKVIQFWTKWKNCDNLILHISTAINPEIIINQHSRCWMMKKKADYLGISAIWVTLTWVAFPEFCFASYIYGLGSGRSPQSANKKLEEKDKKASRRNILLLTKKNNNSSLTR